MKNKMLKVDLIYPFLKTLKICLALRANKHNFGEKNIFGNQKKKRIIGHTFFAALRKHI